MVEPIQIGRLLRAGTTGLVLGCAVSQLEAPLFGSLVRAPIGSEDYQVFGVIHDVHIDDDGLVRQLATAENVDEAIIADNRVNRNVPIEMSVVTVGYQQDGRIMHLLPPRPPLSLDTIYLCNASEIRTFTTSGRFGYFRHLLRPKDRPVAEILAAHLDQANAAHLEVGNVGWLSTATREIITLLRDDYATLMNVLSALSDVYEKPGARA